MSPRTHPNDEPAPVASGLPPYSGPEPTCPKCGLVGAKTAYSNGRKELEAWDRALGRFAIWAETKSVAEMRAEAEERQARLREAEKNEWLDRRCLRCDWKWKEATTGG